MASFDSFYNAYYGRAVDFDGAYGVQCWDGFAVYCSWLGYPAFHCPQTGGARDLWECRGWSGIDKYFTPHYGPPANGDVVIWNNIGIINGRVYGHVAMYYNGGYFGQNQGYDPAFSWVSVGSQVAPCGYLRPKSMANAGPINTTPAPGGSTGPGPTPPEQGDYQEKNQLYMTIKNGIVIKVWTEKKYIQGGGS